MHVDGDDTMALASDDIGFQILQALRTVASQASDYSRELSDESGLTVPQLLCMKAIQEADPGEATVAYVSDAVDLAPSTVSGILDRLERSRLVRRRRDHRDRRQVQLSVTSTGRSRLEELPTLHERFADNLQSLSDRERRQTVEALKTVLALLQGDDPQQALRAASK